MQREESGGDEEGVRRVAVSYQGGAEWEEVRLREREEEDD